MIAIVIINLTRYEKNFSMDVSRHPDLRLNSVYIVQ